jgi:hypothetical protein
MTGSVVPLAAVKHMIQIDDRYHTKFLLKNCVAIPLHARDYAVWMVCQCAPTRPEADKLVDLLPAIKPFPFHSRTSTIERYGAL